MKNFMQFFQYSHNHLPPLRYETAKMFAEMAEHLLKMAPSNPESTVGMRKLMEAKDCFMRAYVFKSEG